MTGCEEPCVNNGRTGQTGELTAAAYFNCFITVLQYGAAVVLWLPLVVSVSDGRVCSLAGH